MEPRQRATLGLQNTMKLSNCKWFLSINCIFFENFVRISCHETSKNIEDILRPLNTSESIDTDTTSKLFSNLYLCFTWRWVTTTKSFNLQKLVKMCNSFWFKDVVMIAVELVEHFRYVLGKLTGNFRYWGNEERSISVQVRGNRECIISSIWQG